MSVTTHPRIPPVVMDNITQQIGNTPLVFAHITNPTPRMQRALFGVLEQRLRLHHEREAAQLAALLIQAYRSPHIVEAMPGLKAAIAATAHDEAPARIRAVLRRAQGGAARMGLVTGDRMVFSDWVLDTRRRELAAPDGSAVDLSSGEYDLLLAFCEHPQRVLSRDQLLDLARNRISDSIDRSVDVMVSRLRRKLEPLPDSPSIIKTIRGAGYMFVPAVARQ